MSSQTQARVTVTSDQAARLAKISPDSDELLVPLQVHGLAPEDHVCCDTCGATEDVFDWVTLAGDEADDEDRECASCLVKAANTAVFTTYLLRLR